MLGKAVLTQMFKEMYTCSRHPFLSVGRFLPIGRVGFAGFNFI